MKRTLAARFLSAAGLVLLASAVVTLLLGDARFLAAKVLLGLLALVAGALLAGRGGRAEALRGRGAHFTAVTVVAGLALAAVLGVVNWMASRDPLVLDVTRERIHTLSPDTLRTLDSLPGDVEVLAFYRPDDAAFGPARELLRRYAERGRRFRFEMVDPYRDPERVRRHGVSDGGVRVVVAPGPGEVRLRELTEESLTNALARAAHPGKRRVYFTQGHGEPSPADTGRGGWSAAAGALAAEGVELVPLPASARGDVPADAAAVLVVGPRRRLLDAEVEGLAAFAGRGGHLAILLEPEAETGLDPLLSALGVEAGNDLVVDPDPMARLAGATALMPVVHPTAAHPVSAPLVDVGVVLPTTRSLVALRGTPVRAVPVLLTSASAWAEGDVAAAFSGAARLDEGKKVGPFPVGLALSARLPGEPPRELRALVLGDSDFLTNAYLPLLGNRDLLLSTVAWLSERDDRIAIRPRTREASRLALSEGQVAALKLVAIDVVPLALLLCGLAVWLVRRER